MPANHVGTMPATHRPAYSAPAHQRSAVHVTARAQGHAQSGVAKGCAVQIDRVRFAHPIQCGCAQVAVCSRADVCETYSVSFVAGKVVSTCPPVHRMYIACSMYIACTKLVSRRRRSRREQRRHRPSTRFARGPAPHKCRFLLVQCVHVSVYPRTLTYSYRTGGVV